MVGKTARLSVALGLAALVATAQAADTTGSANQNMCRAPVNEG